MTKDEIFNIWAPPESVWSRFAKPVLFSFMDEIRIGETAVTGRKWDVPRESGAAVFVDASSDQGVALGMSLADRGYRPIPLYNACPFAANVPAEPLEIPAVVNVTPILVALYQGTKALRELSLPASAPPAFLIDANRTGSQFSGPGRVFDNRSFVSAVDVPASAFLKEHGIARVVVVQDSANARTDLLYILLDWQREGIPILWQTPWTGWRPQQITLKPPSGIARFLRRIALAMGYRRNELGAFGRVVSSSS